MSPSPQVVIVFIAAAVSFGTAGFAYLRQDVTARRTFVWLMAAMGCWSLLSGFHTLAPTLELKVTVAKAQYLAIASVPLLWLLVAHQVVGLPPLRRRHLAALAAIPTLTVAAAWTNDWHSWLWARITPAGSTLVYEHGPWFWVAVAYNYALLLTTFVLLVRSLRSTPSTFHAQLWVMIGAVCLPWVGNVLYLTRAVPIPGLDPTPLTFTLCGVLFSWALTNYRFLDLVPIARSVLLDHMEDGVLVIDRAQRLVDANPTARRLARLAPSTIGQPLHQAVPPLAPPVAESLKRGAAVLVEPFGPDEASIEVRVTPLAGPGKAAAGWLITLRDITTQQSLLRELRAQHAFSLQVMQTMGEGLTVTDAAGVFTFVNEAYARLIGCTAEELIGRSPRDITAEDDHATLHQAWLQRAAGQGSTYRTSLRGADGRVIRVQITGTPRLIDGQLAGSVAVITDLTERLRHEEELHRSHAQLEAVNIRLHELARTDSLTGVHNRGAFNERLADEVFRAEHSPTPLSLLLLDIDHFKQYNDTFGHVAGDGVLRGVARLFQEQARQHDLVARYGGEEFAIILPNTDEAESLLVAERIRRSVERTGWPGRGVTVSIGVATRCEPWTAEQLIELADGALYKAKKRGRNQIAHACQIQGALERREDAGVS